MKVINNIAELLKEYFSLDREKKKIEKRIKELRPSVVKFLKENNNKYETDEFLAKLSESKRKNVREDAPAILREILGEDAENYIVKVETVPKEILERLVLGGVITEEQYEQMVKIFVSDRIQITEK